MLYLHILYSVMASNNRDSLYCFNARQLWSGLSGKLLLALASKIILRYGPCLLLLVTPKKLTNFLYIKGHTENSFIFSLFLYLMRKFLPHIVQHLAVSQCQGQFCCLVVAAETWKSITASLWTKSVKWRLLRQKYRSWNSVVTNYQFHGIGSFSKGLRSTS